MSPGRSAPHTVAAAWAVLLIASVEPDARADGLRNDAAGTAAGPGHARIDALAAATPGVIESGREPLPPPPRRLPAERPAAAATEPSQRGVFHWNGSGAYQSEYRLGSDWALHAGMIGGEARGAGGTRRWPGAGVGFRPNENWNVEFGYVHPYSGDMRGGIELPAAAGSLPGKPAQVGHLLGVSGRLRF